MCRLGLRSAWHSTCTGVPVGGAGGGGGVYQPGGVRDNHGFTPLHLAVQEDHLAALEALLAAGTPPAAVWPAPVTGQAANTNKPPHQGENPAQKYKSHNTMCA